MQNGECKFQNLFDDSHVFAVPPHLLYCGVVKEGC